jgi:hypothetical protein
MEPAKCQVLMQISVNTLKQKKNWCGGHVTRSVSIWSVCGKPQRSLSIPTIVPTTPPVVVVVQMVVLRPPAWMAAQSQASAVMVVTAPMALVAAQAGRQQQRAPMRRLAAVAAGVDRVIRQAIATAARVRMM